MMRTRTWSLATSCARDQRSRVRPLSGQTGFSLDFTKGNSEGLTFTRSTTATYIDTSGNFQLAAINAPRFNCAYGGGAIRGLLCEAQGVNLCLRTAWSNNAATSGANTPPTGWTHPHHNSPAWGSSTSTSEASLHGAADGQSAIRQIAAATRTYLNQTFTCTNGTTYTFSVYVEQVSSGSPTYGNFLYPNAAGGTLGAVTYRLNGAVVSSGTAIGTGRIEATFACTGTGSIGFRVGLGCTGNDTGNVLMSRPHVEAADRASSFVPTGIIGVTRTADFPSVLMTNTPALATVGTAVCSYYRCESAAKTAVAFGLIDAGNDLLYIAQHTGGSTDHDTTDGTVTLASPDGVAGLNRAAFTWGGVGIANAAYSLNGEAAVTDDLTIGTPTHFALGRMRSTRHLCAEIASFAVYAGRYDDAALAVLSA